MRDYNKLFKEIALLRNRKKEVERELEKLEDEVKALMEEACVNELWGDEHKATYKEIISNRFDTTAFKKDHPEIALAYTRASKTMRFTFD